MPAIRNVQEPAYRHEIMRQARDVPEAKTFFPAFAKADGKHQARSDPAEPGDTEIGKGRREQQAGANRQRITAADESAEKFQPAQLASKIIKTNFSARIRTA